MIISAGVFVSVAAFSVIGLIALVAKNQKENDRFISELQFFLKHRTIGHNRVKAQLAVLKTRYDDLQKSFDALNAAGETFGPLEASNFAGPLAQTEFVEAQNSKMEKLEVEITTIREALNGDIKEQISNYMKEIDGLSEKLGKAREEFQTEQNKVVLTDLNSKNIV